MTKHFKITNNILGWILGIFASSIYIITAEPTASWWDCGEYIATTYKMLVGHPPGAPTFQIIGHIFTLFAGNDVTKVALCMNVMSAICSGATIMFLFWTITALGRKMVAKMGEITTGRQIALFGSALVGALAYTFTDSFWFSAVEGEVYAMSSFFTALVFWCILKWEYEYDHQMEGVNPHRWIILIAYLVGLSIGVHLLNLLTLPAIVLIIYFKLSKKASVMGVVLSLAIMSFFAGFIFSVGQMLLIWLFITVPLFILCGMKKALTSWAEWGVFLSLLLSFLLLGIILYGIIPGIVSLSGKFEIFFVNSAGMPFNSGTIIFFLLLFGLVAYGLYYGYKKDKKVLLAGVFSFLFLVFGYSTFITLVIRSNANPTIDENNPEDAVSLLSYLNREQYGTHPFLYGYTMTSSVIGMHDGKPTYVRDDKAGKYVVSDQKKGTEYEYAPEDQMFLPRMWDANHKDTYLSWMRGQYNPSVPDDKENLRYLERIIEKSKSNNRRAGIITHEINMKFMRTYQFGYMYFRYFMWNFSGRQNDIQGRGDLTSGNWITGIPFIDNPRVGSQNNLPSSMERPGHNTYYLLPLLLGIIGIIFYSRKDGKNSFIVLMLFLMTGLAISLYLNDYVFQPRERDYAYAASFYAFAIWVGFGVFGIYSLFEKIKNNKIQVAGAILTTLICLALVPCIMAKENWDDHNRDHRYTALGIAKNYLDSCAPNAILFTLGDNDTFPLWYAQEVEGYRTDVRVCNLSLLGASWYVDQMKRKMYNSEPLPISLTWEQYKDGTRDYAVFAKGTGQYLNLADVIEYIKSPSFDKNRAIFMDGARRMGEGNPAKTIPGSFSLPVDKEKVLSTGTVKPELESQIVDKLTWNLTNNFTSRAYLVMMDILVNNHWERPVYYATTTGPEAYLGLEEYFQLEGMAYRLVPIRTPRSQNYDYGRVDTEILYDKLMNIFDDHTRPDRIKHPELLAQHEPYPYAWGGYNDPRVYQNEDNIRLTGSTRRLFSRLAGSLINEEKLDKAEAVLDHGNMIFPDEIYPYKCSWGDYLGQGYSYSCIQYMQTYFRLGTPSGAEKGMAMARRFTEHLVEDFTWLDNVDNHTLDIQNNMIEVSCAFLDQLLQILTEQQKTELTPLFKQIPTTKAVGYMVDHINSELTPMISKLRDDNMQSIYNDLHLLQNAYGKIAELTGNETLTGKINQSIEKHLADIGKQSPQTAEMLKGYLK
ncbi:MAG: DUF2723 domain-containing protein [Bacteroidales bacterium]|jgi:MFS family permease|nr:DUF2723 domain-containing protein [Bacteroidales bacterium]